MSVKYKAVSWDPFKKRYDFVLAGIFALFAAVYIGLTVATNPSVTAETLILRTTALGAFILLHVILAIGPLSRFDARFKPLLYNRRHLGVTMFLLALVHAVVATIQFHALGPVNPIVSIFTSYGGDYFVSGATRFSDFPFEPFGALALVIFFLMAATSHDFWLKNLGASWWKMLHLGVYFAYGLIVAHVMLGVIQSELHPLYPALLTASAGFLITLHITAWAGERSRDANSNSEAPKAAQTDSAGYVFACNVADLEPGCGHMAHTAGERIALFLNEGKIYATSNVCRHQGGPISEARIIDGCITCSWHGWQYRPEDGVSPPPFQEKLPTYRVKLAGDGEIWVHPEPRPLEEVASDAPSV